MIFGTLNPEKNWHENPTSCPPHLLDVATLPWEIPKSHFQQYYSYTVNLWNAKLFHPTEGLLRSFKRWKLRKEPVVGCRRWLWKESVVMCGNWNVRQAMSQQVFRVTTFCINNLLFSVCFATGYIHSGEIKIFNTCFQSFSTLNCRTVRHAVLKFSPRRNNRCHKPQHVRINTQAPPVACLRRITRAMQIIGSIKQQQVNS